jgi:hypothetical protein
MEARLFECVSDSSHLMLSNNTTIEFNGTAAQKQGLPPAPPAATAAEVDPGAPAPTPGRIGIRTA